MVGLDGSVVAIANPHIAKSLGASLSSLQWITNGYLLALAVLLIFGGKIGDRLGRRETFLVGVVGFALFSLGVAVIGSTDGVIAMRVLQGAFGALLMPNTLALLRATFPDDKLNMAVGIWGGASASSAALGPIVGGLLVEHVSWQSVFLLNLPVGLAALLLGLLVLPASRDESAVPGIDFGGIITLGLGLGAAVYALIEAQTWGWGSPKTLGLLAAGIVLLVLFAVIESRVRTPLLPLRLFSNRSLSISVVVVLIDFFAMYGILFFVTLFLQNVQGFSPVSTGVRMLPLSLLLIIFAPVGGALTQKFGSRMPMAFGLGLMAAGLALMITLHLHSGFWTLAPSLALVGIGLGLVITASSEAIVGNAPVNDAGIAGGLQSTAVQAGGVLGTAILGSILSSEVGSVLVSKLTAAGTPAGVAKSLSSAKELVGEGTAPTSAKLSSAVNQAITTGSHQAFISGLHVAVLVAAGAAVAGMISALFVRRGRATGGVPAAM
jgi:EmrB/QacA subfamily drug resistance transporter